MHEQPGDHNISAGDAWVMHRLKESAAASKKSGHSGGTYLDCRQSEIAECTGGAAKVTTGKRDCPKSCTMQPRYSAANLILFPAELWVEGGQEHLLSLKSLLKSFLKSYCTGQMVKNSSCGRHV